MALNDRKTTYSQHAVPQNIMSVEFKIIGSLTLRQFVYLIVFGGIAYVSLSTMVGFFKWPVSISSILIGVALAFIPIEERGMDEWIVNFVKAMYSPTQRLWRKEAAVPVAFTQQSLAVVRQEMITLAPTSSRRKLEEYLEVQGTNKGLSDPLDIPEQEYLDKIQAAFSVVAPAMQKVEQAPQNVAPVIEPEKFSEITERQEQVAHKSESHEVSTPVKSVSAPVQSTPANKVETVQSKNPVPARKPASKPVKRTYPHMRAADTPSANISHVGRRFTNMLPSDGSIVLPVRGEVVLKTNEELQIEDDIQHRTEQLRKLLDQIKGDSQFKGMVAAKEDVPADESSKQKIHEASDVVKQVKMENEKLSNEIQKLKSDLQGSPESDEQKRRKEELIRKLEEEKTKANSDYSALQQQVHELQKRLQEKEAPKDNNAQKKVAARSSAMRPLTNEPNILSGVLLDPEGTPIDGSVILIKNHKGEAVRAVKSNSIGQFSISTSLTNGMYTLEVGTKTEGLTFDIITVEVKGDVIPPIEIQGRPV